MYLPTAVTQKGNSCHLRWTGYQMENKHKISEAWKEENLHSLIIALTVVDKHETENTCSIGMRTACPAGYSRSDTYVSFSWRVYEERPSQRALTCTEQWTWFLMTCSQVCTYLRDKRKTELIVRYFDIVSTFIQIQRMWCLSSVPAAEDRTRF